MELSLHSWKGILYPELRSLPLNERGKALHRAADTPFEAIELIGMAASIIAVTAFFSDADGEWDGALANTTTNFLLAIPLLASILGIFHVRRMRRGLRTVIDNDVASRPWQ